MPIAFPLGDSATIGRKISNMSDDSIRQLLKIASMDTELQGFPDDIDMSEFTTWDLPSSYYEQSFDLDTEFASSSWDFKFSSEDPSNPILPVTQPPSQDFDFCSKFGGNFGHLTDDSDFEFNSKSLPFDLSPFMDSSLETTKEVFQEIYPTSAPSMGQSGVLGSSSIDIRKLDRSVEVRSPQVNLVLGSNVVLLEPHCCPKPSVTVLPSQVIQSTDAWTTPQIKGIRISFSEQEFTSPSSSRADYFQSSDSWTTNNASFNNPKHDQQIEALFNVQERSSCKMTGTLDQFQSMSDFMDTDNDPPKEDYGQSLPISQKIKKLPETEELIRSLTVEATDCLQTNRIPDTEIRNFVKSVAPQIQNNAWEEILNETDFEHRLKKAELKVSEHNHELDSLRDKIAKGQIERSTGQEMIRKTYNRREAASSRAKREQGLMQAAIKKRALEKICNWMREHLIGNSDLFQESPINHVVRRSLSEGTNGRF